MTPKAATRRKPHSSMSSPESPSSPSSSTAATSAAPTRSSEPTQSHNSWLTVALASGAFAAFNGVFAKLTTTDLTTSWSHALAFYLNASADNKWIEYLVRGLFLALNFLSNAIMWTLFTRALAVSPSATRVSVLNTSSNFLITAVVGWGVFGERLGWMWIVGAGMLIAGCVVIGARDEGDDGGRKTGVVSQDGVEGYRDEVDGEDAGGQELR